MCCPHPGEKFYVSRQSGSNWTVTTRASTSRWFSFCGAGKYSSLETICVGIGVRSLTNSDGVNCSSEPARSYFRETGPKPRHPCHERPVTPTQTNTPWRTPQCNIKLMPEKEVLDLKPSRWLEQVGDKRSQQLEDRKHRDDDALILLIARIPLGSDFGNDRLRLKYAPAASVPMYSQSPRAGCMFSCLFTASLGR